MARRKMTLVIEGEALRPEHKFGTFSPIDRPDEKVAYDYHEVEVLTDDRQVVAVRFPSVGDVVVPAAGERVKISCELYAPKITAKSVEVAQRAKG
jgi:hypothetical protein